jgi:hypothetical protein
LEFARRTSNVRRERRELRERDVRRVNLRRFAANVTFANCSRRSPRTPDVRRERAANAFAE